MAEGGTVKNATKPAATLALLIALQEAALTSKHLVAGSKTAARVDAVSQTLQIAPCCTMRSMAS